MTNKSWQLFGWIYNKVSMRKLVALRSKRDVLFSGIKITEHIGFGILTEGEWDKEEPKAEIHNQILLFEESTTWRKLLHFFGFCNWNNVANYRKCKICGRLEIYESAPDNVGYWSDVTLYDGYNKAYDLLVNGGSNE